MRRLGSLALLSLLYCLCTPQAGYTTEINTASSTLAPLSSEELVRQTLRTQLLATLTEQQWKFSFLNIDINTCDLQALQTLNDIKNVCAFINTKSRWHEIIEQNYGISILSSLRTYPLDNTSDIVNKLLALDIYHAKDTEDINATTLDLLLEFARIPHLSDTCKEKIYLHALSFLATEETPLRFRTKVSSGNIATIMDIFGHLGPVRPSFIQATIPFTFYGFKSEIVRNAIAALHTNRDAVKDTMIRYFTREASQESRATVIPVIDIMLEAYPFEKMKDAQGIFYWFDHKDIAQSSQDTTAGERRYDWILALYPEDQQPVIVQTLDLLGPNIPSFGHWMQSPFAQNIMRGKQEDIKTLSYALERLRQFKAVIGEEAFYLLLKHWRFSYVSHWALVNYDDYAPIITIMVNEITNINTDKVRGGSSYIANIIAACNKNPDDSDALSAAFFELLLSRSIDINAAFISAILDEIAKNPDNMKQMTTFLLIALKLKTVDIPESEFLEEKVSYLLHSNLKDNYYLTMQLIRTLPLKNNLYTDHEKEIRSTVAAIDDGIFHSTNMLFHYLRLKIHREISKGSLYLTDAIIEGIRSGEKEVLWTRITPYTREIAKVKVRESINTMDISGLATIFQHLYGCFGELYRDKTLDELNAQINTLAVDEQSKAVAEKLLFVRHALQHKYSTVFDISELDKDTLKAIEDILGTNTLAQLVSLHMAIQGNRSIDINDVVRLSCLIKNKMRALKLKLLAQSEMSQIEPEKESYSNLHQALDDFNFLLFGFWTRYRETKYDIANTLSLLENINTSLIALTDEHIEMEIKEHLPTMGIATAHPSPTLPDPLRSSILHLCLIIDHLEIQGLGPQRLCQFRDVLLYNQLTTKQIKNLINIIKSDLTPRYQKFIEYRFGNLPYNIARALGTDNLNYEYQTLAGSFSKRKDYFRLVHETFLGNFLGDEEVLITADNLAGKILQLLEKTDDTIIYGTTFDTLPTDTKQLLFDPQNRNEAHMAVDCGSKGYNLVRFKDLAPPFHIFPISELEGNKNDTAQFRTMVINAIIELERKSSTRFPFHLSDSLIEDERDRIEQIRGHAAEDTQQLLIISARSGSFISLPGALETILNIGLTRPVIKECIARGENEQFLMHNYYRFIFSFAIAWAGLPEESLLAIQSQFLSFTNKRHVTELSADDFNELSGLIEGAIRKQALLTNRHAPNFDDPFALLLKSVEAVYNSWESPVSREYRAWNNVSDKWKTSVTLQQMVQGTKNPESFTGIVSLENTRPSGEIVFGQGCEVIASGYAAKGHSLDIIKETHPIIYNKVVDLLFEVQKREDGHNVYLEITGEYDPQKPGDDKYNLYLLQERVRYRIKEGPTEKYEPNPRATDVPIAHGNGTFGGVKAGVFLNGVDVDLKKLKKQVKRIRKLLDEKGLTDTGIFLLFEYFAPSEGVKLLINEVDGCLTTKIGGATHAAWVAGREGKLLVSEVAGLERKNGSWFINNEEIDEAIDVFTVVGFPKHLSKYSGNIYKGAIPLITKKKWSQTVKLQMPNKQNPVNSLLKSA